jgi:hypothetical protein
MAKVLTFEIPENEYNDLKSFLQDCSAEIHKSLEAMKQDQIEINRLDKEIEQIKTETAEIKVESDKVLNELMAKHLKAA